MIANNMIAKTFLISPSSTETGADASSENSVNTSSTTTTSNPYLYSASGFAIIAILPVLTMSAIMTWKRKR